MLKMSGAFGRIRKRLPRAAGFTAVATATVFGLVSAVPSRPRSQAQSSAVAAPVFEYEVASIKPYKYKPSNGSVRTGFVNAPDGFSATAATVQALVELAYGVQTYQVSGGPDWVYYERLEIDAKMDNSVADALKKLSPDERTLARQKMLQALLADRFKLTIHRETKELPVYTLIVAKNGPKLQEAKSDDTPPNALQSRGGSGEPGSILMSARAEGFTMTGKAVPITNLVLNLSPHLRRPVLDKTGLTGKYDFTLKWAREEGLGLQASLPEDAPNDPPALASASDPTRSNLPVAIQQQLGLKLESANGPVEIIVIDHVEKASGN